MVKLVALKSRRFGTTSVRAGEAFHTSRRYARIWKALGLAADPMSMRELMATSEPPPVSTPEFRAPEAIDIVGRTKAELLELAEAAGIDVSRHATKAEIVAALTDDRRNTDHEE